MNKKKLIEIVSKKSNLTKKDTVIAIEAILETITQKLTEGEDVSLIGFGMFLAAKRVARAGINPATKKTINIPEIKVVRFKTGSKLKRAVKNI